MTGLRTAAAGQAFFFSGSADGRTFFRGACASIQVEAGKITLTRRILTRYSFEPGDTVARREQTTLEPLTLPTNDYCVRVTEGLAPPGEDGR
jgi:hypothetical protein